MLSNYSIIPAPASQPVPPTQAPNTDAVDDFLPQVDISNAGHCNCGKMPNVPYCLVSFSTYRDPLEGEADGREGDDEVGSENAEEETSEQDGEHKDDEDEIMTYAEKFKVVGSSFERRYQQALSICVFLRTQKKEPQLDVVHERDNIKDKNALETDQVFTKACLANNLLQNNSSKCLIWYCSLGLLFSIVTG